MLNGLEKRWSRGPDLNRGPVDYESTALPTELPRLGVIHSSIARKKLSNAVAQEVAARNGYRENGNISQPIPIATKRNIRNAHAKYFPHSRSSRCPRPGMAQPASAAEIPRAGLPVPGSVLTASLTSIVLTPKAPAFLSARRLSPRHFLLPRRRSPHCARRTRESKFPA